MEQRISIITLGVSDLARARAFYERGLGWHASRASTAGIVFFDLGGVALALYDRGALGSEAGLRGEPGGATLAHNVRSREAVDQVLARAAAAGATVLGPAVDRFWGGYSGYFHDPEGHAWEVAWNPHLALDDEGRIHLP